MGARFVFLQICEIVKSLFFDIQLERSTYPMDNMLKGTQNNIKTLKNTLYNKSVGAGMWVLSSQTYLNPQSPAPEADALPLGHWAS